MRCLHCCSCEIFPCAHVGKAGLEWPNTTSYTAIPLAVLWPRLHYYKTIQSNTFLSYNVFPLFYETRENFILNTWYYKLNLSTNYMYLTCSNFHAKHWFKYWIHNYNLIRVGPLMSGRPWNISKMCPKHRFRCQVLFRRHTWCRVAILLYAFTQGITASFLQSFLYWYNCCLSGAIGTDILFWTREFKIPIWQQSDQILDQCARYEPHMEFQVLASCVQFYSEWCFGQ